MGNHVKKNTHTEKETGTMEGFRVSGLGRHIAER